MPAALLLLLLSGPASAKVLHVVAYDHDGHSMSKAELLRHIGPSGLGDPARRGGDGGLYLSDERDNPLKGRPWWVEDSSMTAWNWEGSPKVRASLPWPIDKDGFSTVFIDGGGNGYADGQTILLNEEIAVTSYRLMQESYKERTARKEPYQPGKRTAVMIEQAKAAVATATGEKEEARRAALFDKATQLVSFAWQQILFEHGREMSENPKLKPYLRWGLTLDESLVDRVSEFEWLADRAADSGANWVRVVFKANPRDFTYSSPSSFTLYDQMIEHLKKKKMRVMISVLDSMLWPPDVTQEAYVQRTRNLAMRYKDTVRSWEVASEPNGNWLGGAKNPLPDEVILGAVTAAAAEIKRLDPALETVATLHWWEGTAPDDRHPLFAWLNWSVPKGFGKDFDVISLSVYPNRHPLGMAFDTVFRKLYAQFPDKKLMLGGFNFLDENRFSGYWWLEPENIDDARKDLMIFFAGAACSVPHGVGGGFWWPTLSQMMPPRKKVTSLYRIYKQTLKKLER